ncbi:MAG TPA: archease [Candidatus Bathyarchaeia archaeon]|nr:archease [Candidatus Bathyarchaeia archaeon]
MGSWQLLDAVAIADCALEILGDDLGDLFATGAQALAEIMVDPATVSRDAERSLRLEAGALDLLFHEWLSELIFLKDRDQVVFPDAIVSVCPMPPALTARVSGGRIDPATTARRADPKAVTFHQFILEPRGTGWYARVVIDI